MKKILYSILMLWHIAFVSSCKYKIEDDNDPKPYKDPLMELLTGKDYKGKTWKICADADQTKIYPLAYLKNQKVAPYWNFYSGLVDACDMDGWLKNAFTFSSKNNQFTPLNQQARGHWAYLNIFWGFQQEKFVDLAVRDPHLKQTTFQFKDEKTGIGTGYTLDIAHNGHLGFLAERQSKYYVMSLNQDTMRVAFVFKEYTVEDGKMIENHQPIVWQSTLVTE